jgi:hypothetical protein
MNRVGGNDRLARQDRHAVGAALKVHEASEGVMHAERLSQPLRLRHLPASFRSIDETSAVRWLADSRRVLYFTKTGQELVVLDTVTRARTVVDVRLPGPSTNEIFALSPDNRTIYYGAARAEADIWLVERK